MHDENARDKSERSTFVIICTCLAGLCVGTSFRVYYVRERRAGQRLEYDDNMGIAVEEEHGLDERNAVVNADIP